MKKIVFSRHVLPHIIAVSLFLLVTVFFFKPVFFDNKVLDQYDIQQFQGSSKSIADYRQDTGEEALWADRMFSGMPAYMVSVQWGNEAIGLLKRVLSVFLPHPINNIFLAFVCYYIMLLAFGIRPYLAIGGALAFGLSSYMIIGLAAGHNARIGAIAFMPLIMAGIHLAFSERRILGLGVTAAAIALQLRENHVQITYYLLLIVLVYGIVRLTGAIREQTLPGFLKTLGALAIAAIIGAGTAFGPLWAITEYSKYSTRGKSELASATPSPEAEGMARSYAFEYSNGILEPMVLLIPNFYGGPTSNYLVQDNDSETYKALVGSGNEQLANQLARFTSSYWGPQFDTAGGTAPYYGGAVIVFLFAVGIAFAEKKYVWWLVPLAVLAVMLSWGKNFSLNFLIFDYLPGYNKFRSVTFTLIIILFAMPLLGLLGVERLWAKGINKESKRKLWMAFAATGGLCFLILLFAGFFSFTNAGEAQLPAWFLDALADDRKSLLRSDAFRSFAFIAAAFIMLFFDVHKRISPTGFFAFMIFIIMVDLVVVDKRYFTADRFKRKREASAFNAASEADQAILADKSFYRVYNLQGAFLEARTSYHHHSIGGYHGAKLRRYQEFYDSCLAKQTQEFIQLVQSGSMDFSSLGGINMLNVKYITFGAQRDNVIANRSANGSAWFVREVETVDNPTEELARTCVINTKTTAVVDGSAFNVEAIRADPAATIAVVDRDPRNLKYESESSAPGLAVFSEIYYPKGWRATIDGAEADIIRVNYILRALRIPAGKHTIEFRFEPKPYVVGNKVTTASSWLVVLLLLGSIGWTLRSPKES